MSDDLLKRLLFPILFSFFASGLWAQNSNKECVHAFDFPSLLDSLSERLQIQFSYESGTLPTISPVEFCFSSDSWSVTLAQILGSSYRVVKLHSSWVIRFEKAPVKRIEVSGKVKDAKNGVPVAFAHVGVLNELIGTVTNSEGRFLLKIDPTLSGREALVSVVGYEPYHFILPVSDTVIDMVISPVSIRLPEIQVRYVKAQQVLDHFFKNHKRNYPQENYWLDGFFREALYQDEKLVQVSEATVEVLKGSYSNNGQLEQVRVIKGRKSAPPEILQKIVFKMEGGPFQFSRLDVARYFDFLPVLQRPDLYGYHFDGVDYFYGKPVFRIEFQPLSDNGDLRYQGFLFFDMDSYALVRADFKLTRKALLESGRALIKKTSSGLKAKPVQAVYQVQYKPLNGKWWLSGVKGELGIKIKSSRLNALMFAVSEWVITNVHEAGDDRLRSSENIRSNYVLYDEISEFEPDFWQEMNIIHPLKMEPEQ